MSYQTLSEKLAVLQESNAQLRDLIERLATIKFQPGSVPLNNEDGDVLEELSAEIQQTLKDQDDDFELLLEEVKDLDSGRSGSAFEEQKLGLEQSVIKAIKDLGASQSSFRKAQLTARVNLQAAQRAERDLLLQSYLEPHSNTSAPGPSAQQRRRAPQRTSSPSVDNKTVSASGDVTLALRRTHDLMASELSRSQFAHDTLKESTAALAQLNETYSALDTLLSSSRNLLGTLLRSQKSDTWYLESAFYILCTTIAWLVFRRFFYGPLWWFMWIPLKMFVKGSMGVLTAVGLVGGGKDVGGNVSAMGESVLQSPSTTMAATLTMSGTGAPIVSVGVDDRDAPRSLSDIAPKISQPSGERVSEILGRIINESSSERLTEGGQSDEGVEAPETEQEPEHEIARNSKKRMWEEPVEAVKEEQRKKDEL